MMRRYWPETLLVLAVALPWISLMVLGFVWLWQGGHVWKWAIAAGVLALLAWPLARLVRRRANAEARLALGNLAEPSRAWTGREQEAWDEVRAIADATAPFSFTELDPLVASARQTIEAVARRLHPETHTPWAQFSLAEVLLLGERLCRDVRQEALRHIPAIRALRLSHLFWVQRQSERYGATLNTVMRFYRLVRAVLNPLQAVGSETAGMFADKVATVLSYRLRAHATQMFVHKIGRAAIDLYAGRLALSDEELRLAREADATASAEPAAPVRLVLAGQVNAGKSSLVNALAQETRGAVGPLPTTSRAIEYAIEIEGRPAVSLVDMPGLGGDGAAAEFLLQAERADLVLWVASATQPARDPDSQALDRFRAWAARQLTRRPPRVLLVLTHIDELRPANKWMPPYDLAASAEPKARSIRAAIDSVGSALDFNADAIVPVAMPPGRAPYNIDALWARIAIYLDEARLVQLDRLRIGGQQLSLRELAAQLGHTGRFILGGIAKSSS
jgi:predicted GTPase